MQMNVAVGNTYNKSLWTDFIHPVRDIWSHMHHICEIEFIKTTDGRRSRSLT